MSPENASSLVVLRVPGVGCEKQPTPAASDRRVYPFPRRGRFGGLGRAASGAAGDAGASRRCGRARRTATRPDA